jgi:hypothetical protein
MAKHATDRSGGKAGRGGAEAGQILGTVVGEVLDNLHLGGGTTGWFCLPDTATSGTSIARAISLSSFQSPAQDGQSPLVGRPCRCRAQAPLSTADRPPVSRNPFGWPSTLTSTARTLSRATTRRPQKPRITICPSGRTTTPPRAAARANAVAEATPTTVTNVASTGASGTRSANKRTPPSGPTTPAKTAITARPVTYPSER